MPAILVKVSDDQHQRIKEAAASAGMSVRKWCRQRLAEAALRASGEGRDDLLGMVQAIRDAVCSRSSLPRDAADAVEALLTLGLTLDMARKRVERIVAESPKAPVDEIIRKALAQ